MNIIFEENIRTVSVKDVAAKMMLAARTAPKARGIDNLVIALIEKKDIVTVANEMQAIAATPAAAQVASAFLRDAANILSAEAILVIGTKIKALGLADCGLCGFHDCKEKNLHPKNPCAFNTGDLGIALGTAVSVASEHRIDNRIMHTVGKAIRNLKSLGEDVQICFGIPLSASSKNVFFDRKPI